MKIYTTILTLLLLFFSTNIISSPILTEPPTNEDIITSEPVFEWTAISGATSYEIEFSLESTFLTVYQTAISNNNQFESPSGFFTRGNTYYWKVRAIINSVPDDWSSVSNFRIINDPIKELDYIKGIVETLESQNLLAIQQGNILQLFLNQSQTFLINNQINPAINKLNAFCNHTQALINGNQISANNGNMLINKANNVSSLILTGYSVIPNSEGNAPKQIYIKQNYPNPFNPETYIEYSIPNSTNVTLKIYSETGAEIDQLINGYQEAGRYIIKWNAENRSSGFYFYKIMAGSYSETKKMMLIK